MSYIDNKESLDNMYDKTIANAEINDLGSLVIIYKDGTKTIIDIVDSKLIVG